MEVSRQEAYREVSPVAIEVMLDKQIVLFLQELRPTSAFHYGMTLQ